MEIIKEISDIYKEIQNVENKIANMKAVDKDLLERYSYELFQLKLKMQKLENEAYLYIKPNYEDEEIDLYIKNIHDTFDNNPDNLSYIITLHGTKTKVGMINVRFSLLKSEEYLGNIGARINEEYRGRRYVKKAFVLLKDVLLERGLTKPIMTVNINNTSSIKAINAIGAKKVSMVEDVEEPYYIYEYDFLESRREK